MKQELNELIIKLNHMITLSDSEKAKDAYMYSINELHSILEWLNSCDYLMRTHGTKS